MIEYEGASVGGECRSTVPKVWSHIGYVIITSADAWRGEGMVVGGNLIVFVGLAIGEGILTDPGVCALVKRVRRTKW